jgi:hypothetical protein
MELFDHSNKKPSELMNQDRYTPEELATLLDVNVNLIRSACYEGQLKCKIVGHDIVSIERADALEWSKNI